MNNLIETDKTLAEFKHATSTLGKDLRELSKYYNNHIRILERVWDGIPAMIFFKDVDNRLIKVNQYMAELLGKDVKDLEDVALVDLGWSCELTEKYFKNDTDIIRNKIPKLGIVEPLGDAGMTVITNKYPIFNEAGDVIGILGISTKI